MLLFYFTGTKKCGLIDAGDNPIVMAAASLKWAVKSLRMAEAIYCLGFALERIELLEKVDQAVAKGGGSILIGSVVVATIFTFITGIWTGHLIAMAFFFCLEIVAAAIVAGDLCAYLIVIITTVLSSYAIYESDPPTEASFILFGWKVFTLFSIHLAVCYVSLLYRQIRGFLTPSRNSLLARELVDFREMRQLIFRPYVNVRWSVWRRMEAVVNHYALVENHSHVFALPCDEYVDLATLAVNDSVLRVVLSRPAWMRREGEIGVSLFWGDDRIYTAMLLLDGTPDDMQLIIGNLQGDGRDRAELYRRLTKALHGLRPRDLLFNVVQMIAHELGCRNILGISDRSHRSMHWLSNATKLATYDAIWREHGGVLDDRTSFYRLRTTLAKRIAQDIPTNKRAMYRRRYQLLDNLQLQIQKAIASPLPGIKNDPNWS